MLALAQEDAPEALIAPAVPQHKEVIDEGVSGALVTCAGSAALWIN